MAEYFPFDVNFKSYSGSFSGSFFGDGSGLTNVKSFNISGSVTSASYAATASLLLGSVTSASYALTASFALNGGGGAVFPYTGSAIITGSLIVTGSTTSTLGFTGSLFGTASFSTTASYALTSSYATTAANGGVTKILAGANINLSPVNGLGDVTVTSFGTNLYNTATGSYGSFYDTSSVSATSTTAIYSMSLSTTDISNGVFISASGGDITRIKFTNAGTYNVQFSSQFSNSDNSIQDVVIWVKKNGVDVVDSSGVVGVPPFKAGSNEQAIAGWNYFLNLSANDFIQLCWHVEQANVITLETIAAGTTPTHPRTPSTILTAQRVDTFLSNTGSFSGSFTGALTGTSSWATNALTASLAPNYVLNSQTSSMSVATASLALRASGSLTGSLLGTASYATTASYALSSPGGAAFPYTGNAQITGSLVVKDPTSGFENFKVSGGLASYALKSGVIGAFTIDAGGLIFQAGQSAGGSYINMGDIGGGGNSTAITIADLGSPSINMYAPNNMTIQGGTISIVSPLVASSGVTVSGNSLITNGYAIAANAGITITGSLLATGSAVLRGPLTITGSLNVSGSITGSLFGTASFATTASFLLGSVTSASFASTASFVNPLRQTVQITGSLTVTGSVISNTDGLNRLARYGTAISGSTIGTGVTAQTIVYQQLIPANTFSAGNIFRTYYRFRKLSTNSNATHNILVNTTSGSVAGATTIALLTANTVLNPMKRDFYISQGSTTTFLSSGVSNASDDNQGVMGTSVINWAVDQYLMYTVTLGTTDSGYGLGYTIEQTL